MSDIIRYPWESKAQFAKDPLYAVKSTAKGGHYMVGGVPLRYGQWKLNVREREVMQKNLLSKDTECICMTMEEYRKQENEPKPELPVSKDDQAVGGKAEKESDKHENLDQKANENEQYASSLEVEKVDEIAEEIKPEPKKKSAKKGGRKKKAKEE